MTRSRVVVVGAGAAGWSTVEALRRFGFDGRITVLSDEVHLPYDRPPLSKQVLSGEWEPGRAQLASAHRIAEADVEWALGVTAAALHSADRLVVTVDGRPYPYDELVIATGVRARRLPVLARDALVLRTLDDCVALRERLRTARSLVVLGAGFLGLEVAATALARGVAVTVIDPQRHPLADRLGSAAASSLVAQHRSRGVRVLTGTAVCQTQRVAERDFWLLRLSDDTTISADLVLVAAGSVPAVEWLAGTSLEVDDGVLCDSEGRAAPHVWAVGDVARWYRPDLGQHVRFEHRTSAVEQGQAVARAICGAPATGRAIPFFWTDQFDLKIQVWGSTSSAADVDVVFGDPGGPAYVAVFHDGDVASPTGVLAWNAAGPSRPYREALVRERSTA
ncbi:FAD-dependent oxidoreductase [Pseudonocardia kujensis]|uniref:NAD(P)/FAD-dependent oxidoreductase n=1 Tax=Pseudonocardia kujensis TaxID=1128675 RepID=UPI001E29B9FC|nr:FAD-dependent oxidoreductase [Pseudonocardia kujensis]MCE0765064.1 FAD-dependent oxidoreductase [Pseudonocardia kujensis]